MAVSKQLKKWLKAIVSLGLITYLFSRVDISVVLDRLLGVDLSVLIIAVPLLLLQAMLSTQKWKLILGISGVEQHFSFLLQTYLKGNFVSLFLPTSFGGDVYRAMRLNQQSGRVVDSASSVIFDRLTGLYALLTIAVVAYTLLPQLEYKVWFVLAYLVGCVAFLLLTSERSMSALPTFSSKTLQKVTMAMKVISDYRRARAVLALILMIAFTFQFNIVIINKVYATALGVDISFWVLLAIIPVIYLTEILPISINGIGVRDSAFVFFFVLLGHSQEEGLAMALLVLLFRYFIGSIGGLIFLTDSIKPESPN